MRPGRAERLQRWRRLVIERDRRDRQADEVVREEARAHGKRDRELWAGIGAALLPCVRVQLDDDVTRAMEAARHAASA